MVPTTRLCGWSKEHIAKFDALLSLKRGTGTVFARELWETQASVRRRANVDIRPIHTYNGQATLKPNLPERQQHAIIYTSQDCPPEHWYTATDGSIVKENLTKDAIRVKREQKGPEGDLGEYSRLNYSKIYTVENYVRVLNIGIVERDWLPALNANSYVKNSETLGPVEKPTNHKPPRDSGRSSRDSGGGHHKGKESRRTRR